jgi:subtilisin family serine protease
MKKGIILALSAVIALVAIQWLISSDDTLIKSQVTQDVPLAVEGVTKSRADKSLQVVKQSKDAKKESATTSAPTEAESSLDDPAARSLAYQEATVTFKSLGASEKQQRRKTALSKVIAGKGVGVADEVALQQSWELAGRAEPGYQHKKDTTKIDVNGTIVDVAQPGVVVADSVMVYIPQSKAALVAELGAVAGISNIEPLFKNAKPSTVAGVRDLSGWQKIELSAPASRIRSIVRALKSFDGVSEAEPVYERKLSITGPLVSELDDPKMGDQWHLDAANIKEAWAYLESTDKPAGGSESIVVAVIDTGVDYNHPDLSANMWVNTQEIPGNGVDDDNNGFVDDIHGAAVVSESFSHSGDPDDDHGHGTHVAGIIASTGANGVGVVGVAYNSKIMAIKAAQYSGTLTTTDIAEGIYYAVDNGADVINMSFGGYGRSQVEEDALALAYSQAVLVAAAGNDGRPNDARCKGAPMYPGAYAWVLGVMARTEFPNAKGDYLAGFSNWDCTPSNGLEYELMAPGAAIWSTLPDGSYSAWSGTSMAAPVVAGMAALARTRWPDKTTHSSRFIMGQVGATGGSTQAFTPQKGDPVSYAQADAYNALTSTPEPELSFEEFWLFDEVAQGDGNDGDGRVDAGETVELAIVIRNRWGKADNVVATLSTPSGAAAADPYVTFQTASVNYGAVGSFNKDDNGIEYDEGLLVTGVRNPFVFSVDANTPNNHIIPITITMTAENGLDPDDATNYSFTSTFELVVQRGRELPSIINGDAIGTDGGNVDTDGVEDGVVTLDSSALWIVDKPVLISKGTAVKVTEGAQIQFWSSLPDEAYTVWRTAYIQVEGSLDIEGTAINPVTMFPSALFPTRTVIFYTSGQGSVQMTYSKVTNMYSQSMSMGDGTGFTKMDYNLFDRYGPDQSLYGTQDTTSANNLCCQSHPSIPSVQGAKGNRFYKLGFTGYLWNDDKNYGYPVPYGQDMALVDGATRLYGGGTSVAKNTVYLKNIQTKERYDGKVYLGSKFENLAPSADYALVEPFEFGGKTYAIFYSTTQSSSESTISDARSVARELGGTLLTVSSKDEIIAVNNWMYDLQTKPSSYWEDKYTLCDPVSEEDTFCKSQFASRDFYSGLLRQGDGAYEWDGDDSGYGDTFLAAQYNWDQDQWQIDGGNTPQAYEIDYEVEAKIIVMSSNQPMDADINVRWYPFSYIISSNNRYQSSSATKFIVELPGELTQNDLDVGLANFKTNKTNTSFYNNAILNTWHDLDPMHWATIEGPGGDTSRRWDYTMDISGNFWGGAGDALVDIAITDFSDDFNKARVKYKPTLTTGAETAYPFVVKAEVLDADGVRPSADRFGAQASKWRITFNRDMDTTLQPLVTFGPAEPFTDFSIPGDWTDARTWEGTWTFNAITGDGWQNIRVAGAVAADNPWLVTGDDSERFRFELITSGTEALTLQASGARGSVSLSWTQDDFELLHGYNLYRSMTEEGTYTRINSSTINKSITSFLDTDVTPGVGHYYYFTVVSDSGESSPSNIALATPTDTILPVVTHITESVVSQGDNLTLRATVTDNIAVTAVNMVFRNAASTDWLTRAMAKTDTDRYSITMSGSDIGNQYLEYYIEAKDSANTALSGSAESPHKVYVSLPSDTDTDGDGVNNAEDAFPYDPSESGDFDDDGVGDNADPDDDSDGHLDTEDAFPRDASEWVDTDQDGLGNNADPDDDDDGVDDGQDAFPLDDRGAVDSDGDGLPNKWETDNGLNPNDPSDSDSDLDFDGYTALQEFNAKTSPTVADQKTQIVYYEAEPFVGGVTNSVQVYYRTSDGITGLNGLGLRVHFNSRLIDVVALKDLLLVDLISADAVVMLDSSDFDSDDLTDSYLTLAWAAQSGSSWPGVVPIKLFDLEVIFSSQITSDDKVNIRFTATSTHPDYGFSGTPLKATVNVNSLDIDGSGDADALSDGLLILRNMFGLTGEALIINAVPTSAKYTSAADIEARISGLGLLLDVDGDSRIDPLSDGLLILRYLFGLTGSSLTNGVISQDATRITPQAIEEYLSRLAPNS